MRTKFLAALAAAACLGWPCRGSAPNNFPGLGDANFGQETLIPHSRGGVPLTGAPTKIRTLVAALPALKGKTFVVQPLDGKKNLDWNFGAVTAQVADALGHQGMAPRHSGEAPDLVVWIDYVSARTVVFDKFLVVVISAKKNILYKAVVATAKPDEEMSEVVPALLRTFFRNFPDKSGRSRVVDLVE